MPAVVIVCADADRCRVESILLPALKWPDLEVGFNTTPSTHSPSRKESDPWYILILTPRLVERKGLIHSIMEAHPERVIPVLLEECNRSEIHPRLEFLAAADCRATPDEAAWRIAQTWKREGLGRARTGYPIVMVLSLKGGVAKTTNTVALAECLAEQGNRVLVIDTDHQCAASALLLGEDRLELLEHRGRTLADLFHNMLDNDFDPSTIASRYAVSPVSNIRNGLPTLSVIPCSLRIEDFWFNLPRSRRDVQAPDEWRRFLFTRRSKEVRRWLHRNYDLVFIDCPPSVCWQVRFFLRTADAFIVPAIPDRLSLRGAEYLMRRINNLHLSKIYPLGLLWSMRRAENAIHTETMRRVAAQGVYAPCGQGALPEPFNTVIPNATAITRATEQGQNPKTFTLKYESQFARIYRELGLEILQRMQQGAQAQTSAASPPCPPDDSDLPGQEEPPETDERITVLPAPKPLPPPAVGTNGGGRPYQKHQIPQLEELFEQHKENLSLIRILRAELDHRATTRALQLRAKVDFHLKQLV